MQKSYTHLLKNCLINQPFMIAEAKLDIIMSRVAARMFAGQALDKNIEPTPHTSVTSKDIPIIEVYDVLMSKGLGLGASGFTTYESITNSLKNLVSQGHKTIILNIDSPGGMTSGMLGLTSYMASLKEQGITLIGITDGTCASAAYAIGSACSKLYATASSEIGSIGVIGTLVDATEADKEEGLKYTILRSKDEKALGNPHEPITDKVVSDLKAHIMQLDAMFNAEVHKNRPSVSIEDIIATKGNSFLGEEALRLNFIDGIIPSLQSFIENNSLASNKSSQQPNTRGITMSEMTMESVLAKNVELSTALANANASLASAEQRGKQEEQQRILGILKAGTTFGIGANSIEKVILAGFTSEQATMNFEMAKEAAQAMQTPNTVIPQQAGVVASLAAKASAGTQGKVTWSKEFL